MELDEAIKYAGTGIHGMVPYAVEAELAEEMLELVVRTRNMAFELTEAAEKPTPPAPAYDGYGVDPALGLTDMPYEFDKTYVDAPGQAVVIRHFHGPAPNGANYTGNGLGGGYSPHKDDTLVEDCLISHTKKWGMRNYSMRRNNVIRRVTFRDCQDEHAIYLNPAGYNVGEMFEPFGSDPCVTIENCLFEDVHSQAIQFRQPEGKPEKTAGGADDWTPGGALIVRHCMARNISQIGVGGRPSFAFSFQRSRNPVLVERVTLDNSMQERSRGALLVEGYGQSYDAPVGTDLYQREAIIRDSSFTLGHAEQAVAKFVDMKRVEITGCHFEATGGHTWLSFENCDEILVKDCTGNVEIRVDNGGSDGTGWVDPIEVGYATP